MNDSLVKELELRREELLKQRSIFISQIDEVCLKTGTFLAEQTNFMMLTHVCYRGGYWIKGSEESTNAFVVEMRVRGEDNKPIFGTTIDLRLCDNNTYEIGNSSCRFTDEKDPDFLVLQSVVFIAQNIQMFLDMIPWKKLEDIHKEGRNISEAMEEIEAQIRAIQTEAKDQEWKEIESIIESGKKLHFNYSMSYGRECIFSDPKFTYCLEKQTPKLYYFKVTNSTFPNISDRYWDTRFGKEEIKRVFFNGLKVQDGKTIPLFNVIE